MIAGPTLNSLFCVNVKSLQNLFLGFLQQSLRLLYSPDSKTKGGIISKSILKENFKKYVVPAGRRLWLWNMNQFSGFHFLLTHWSCLFPPPLKRTSRDTTSTLFFFYYLKNFWYSR